MQDKRAVWFTLKSLSRMACVLAFRMRAFGQRRVPERGGVLVVANHQSYLDPILVGIGLQRPVFYMARRTLFNNPLFGWLLHHLHTFPVTRGGRDIEALRQAVALLRDGQCLVVFPEGTRSVDGQIGQLQHGILTIADRANVPIVPAVVDGAYDAWPKGRGIRLRPVRVLYGEAISPEARQGRDRAQNADAIRNAMLALQERLRLQHRGVRNMEPGRDRSALAGQAGS